VKRGATFLTSESFRLVADEVDADIDCHLPGVVAGITRSKIDSPSSGIPKYASKPEYRSWVPSLCDRAQYASDSKTRTAHWDHEVSPSEILSALTSRSGAFPSLQGPLNPAGELAKPSPSRKRFVHSAPVERVGNMACSQSWI